MGTLACRITQHCTGPARRAGLWYTKDWSAPGRPVNVYPLYRLTMTLIETHPDESDTDLRAVVDGILQSLNPKKLNWWHPYELRGAQRRGNKLFREFYCVAGSVEIWLWKLAGEGKSREVLMLGNGDDRT